MNQRAGLTWPSILKMRRRRMGTGFEAKPDGE
jgi:hypothetical protein